MVLDTPPQAQAGDELARQLQSSLQAQLSLAEDFQSRAQERFPELQKRTNEVQAFARGTDPGQGASSVEALRNLGERVSGEAPSALLTASSGLGRALQTGLDETVAAERRGFQETQSDNVINIISKMISLKERQDEAVRQSVKDGFKVTADGTIEPLSEQEFAQRELVGEDAVAEVIKQGGSDLVRKGGTKDERYAIAESILRSGGIQQYKQQIPLIELITNSEEKDIKTQTDLLQLIDQGVALFSGTDVKTGTGPFAALIPGFLAGEKTRSLRRVVENVKAQYAKIISGATVSDREMSRLEKFLPTSGKTETENLEDLKQLSKDLMINQLIFEKGKREGLTANQAYSEYGQEIFDQFEGTGAGSSNQDNDKILEEMGF
jgi:hypothetical protein